MYFCTEYNDVKVLQNLYMSANVKFETQTAFAIFLREISTNIIQNKKLFKLKSVLNLENENICTANGGKV